MVSAQDLTLLRGVTLVPSWTAHVPLTGGLASTDVNPLTDLPLAGPLVSYVDEVAVNAGTPQWFRELIELALLIIAAYLVLRLIARQLLPWIGKHSAGPIIALVDVLRVLFLLPDLAATRVMGHLNRRPPGIVYFYGNSVLTVADGLIKIARHSLPGLAQARRIPPSALALVLAVTFFAWNSTVCVPATGTACVSPVGHWVETYQAGR